MSVDALDLSRRPAEQGFGPGALRRFAPTLPWALLGLTAALMAAACGLIVAADVSHGGLSYHSFDIAVFFVAFPVLPVMGATLAVRRPDNPVGWLLLLSALAIAASVFAHGYGEYGVEARPGALPGTRAVVWTSWIGWVGFALSALFLPLMYPDGRLNRRLRGAVMALGLTAVTVQTLTSALRPGPLADFPDVANPVGVPALDGLLNAAEKISGPLAVVALLASLTALGARYRTSSDAHRRQIRAMAVAVPLLLAVHALTRGASGGYGVQCTWGSGAARPILGSVLPMSVFVGLPVAVAFAVAPHRLFGIDRLLRRSAIYAVLWTAIAAAYLGVAWALSLAVSGRLPWAAGIPVAIVTATAFQPARRRLERLADRFVFGDRPSHYELASGFGQAAGGAEALDDLASQLAEIVRRGLGLEWARVSLGRRGPDGDDGETMAGAGVASGAPVLVVPLGGPEGPAGRVECGPKVDGRWVCADHELLGLLAGEAALAFHNVTLARDLAAQVDVTRAQADELAASRARLVAAADDERQRLERDLHDGAQQELVALIAKARLALDHLHRDPISVETTVRELQRDARTVLAGIRELAQGLHPSILTDRGLVAAVESRAGRMPVPVSVEAGTDVRGVRFPVPVETTAFFVISEALANVLKHADATRIEVRMAADRTTLTVVVIDDGRGFEAVRGPRGGLTNMADRLAAAGGGLTVASEPGSGTRVTATLPSAGPPGPERDG